MIYHGSKIFESIAEASGLKIDQFNYILVQFAALVIGLLFRAYLKPCTQNILSRHLVAIFFGICFGHFCFGFQMLYLYVQTLITYAALNFFPRNYVQLFVCFSMMGCLSLHHIYRQIYDYGSNIIDITCPMMIITQKLTALAFAYHDGMKSDNELTEDQKSQAIKKIPSLIELLSYVFNFQGIILGPLCYFKDYIEFINGENILKYQKKIYEPLEIDQPSVTKPLITKLLSLVGLIYIFFNFTLKYPISSNLRGSQRFKYYFAWVLADAVNNASGLGFNGYDENGNAKWDMTSTNIKSVFDHWNTQTQRWLRRIAFDRLPTGKTLGVFILSAFWHGFYPGYYLTFVLAGLMVYAGRGIRRKIRPHFQKNSYTILFYGIVTWIFNVIGVSYAMIAFDLLEFWKAIEFYNSWYWIPHIVTLVVIIVLPGGSSKPKNQEHQVKQAEHLKTH